MHISDITVNPFEAKILDKLQIHDCVHKRCFWSFVSPI